MSSGKESFIPEQVKQGSPACSGQIALNRILKNPVNFLARQAVHHAVKCGQLVPAASCEHCGIEGRTVAHHEEYDLEKLLDVVWLCKECHKDAHGR